MIEKIIFDSHTQADEHEKEEDDLEQIKDSPIFQQINPQHFHSLYPNKNTIIKDCKDKKIKKTSFSPKKLNMTHIPKKIIENVNVKNNVKNQIKNNSKNEDRSKLASKNYLMNLHFLERK